MAPAGASKENAFSMRPAVEASDRFCRNWPPAMMVPCSRMTGMMTTVERQDFGSSRLKRRFTRAWSPVDGLQACRDFPANGNAEARNSSISKQRGETVGNHFASLVGAVARLRVQHQRRTDGELSPRAERCPH